MLDVRRARADRAAIEYVGGEIEYHAHATDPNELDNTAAALLPA